MELRFVSTVAIALYVAFVHKRGGDLVKIDMGQAQAIVDLIMEFRTAPSTPTSTYVKEVAAELSTNLYKPLLPHLEQSEGLLISSPDGVLNLVSFAPAAAAVDSSRQQTLEYSCSLASIAT